jgi:hypothetical protein
MIYHLRDTDLLGNLSRVSAHAPPARFPGYRSPPLRSAWLCAPAQSISGCDPSMKSDRSIQTFGGIQPLPAGLACARCQRPSACGNAFDRCLSMLLSDPLGCFSVPPAPLLLAAIRSSAGSLLFGLIYTPSWHTPRLASTINRLYRLLQLRRGTQQQQRTPAVC